MQESGFPSLNLITEKISFEGITRFEDKYRLPMGISVNQSGAADGPACSHSKGGSEHMLRLCAAVGICLVHSSVSGSA